MFELTNEQRKYLGITLVSASWDFIKLTPSPYDKHDSFAYFEGNTICKRILIGENSYVEYDLNEVTTNFRAELLPKTERGEIVKLTASTLEKKLQRECIFLITTAMYISVIVKRTEHFIIPQVKR